ncbi:MAG: PEGA domain-containing protein [Bacteroidales bacterium]|nr:PEGA domain-containing protein [Bacteroidales bacterium]
MKRFFLILLILVSLDVVAQNDYFKIKEGSFTHIEGAVMDDAKEHTDVDNKPMALFKISTENINDEERHKLYFTGNRVTEISDKVYKTGSVWIYITAEHSDFLEIRHPDYGVTRFYFPESLCDFCTYEMVLQYIDPTPAVETGFLAVSTEPNEAEVYVDGKHYGKTMTVITDLAEGSHTLKLEKQGYVTLTKSINIVKGETLKLNETLQTVSSQKTYLIVKADKPEAMIYIDDEPINTGEASKSVNIGTTHTYKIECNLYHEENGTVTVNDRMTIEKKLRPNFGYISISTSPEQGAKVFVDGDYLGVSPIKTDKLASGTHTVRVMKDMYKMKEQSFTVIDGQTTNANLTMSANFVMLTVDTDADSDIYVDEEYKGKGKWTGRVSEGLHNVEARKANHRSSTKTVDLVLGENKTMTLEAPQPISGSIDVNSSPMSAEIYIDGKHYGQTPNYINEILIGTHELKLEKQGCATITKTITIKENETLTVNEKLQTGKEITIKTDKSGDKIYVDNNYVGLSPVTTSLAFGSHTIKAERDGKYVNKTINVSQYGGDNSVILAFVQKINGHEYVDLGLSVKWATCNVGASKPEDYGNDYAWGETSTKSSYTSDSSKTYGKQMNDIKGNSQYDAARANWGGTWRLPTGAELEELKNKCTWRWTTQNGVKGYKVTGPNGNSIFLSAAGCRLGSSLYYAGEDGYYWSSTPTESGSNSAFYLDFDIGGQGVDWYYRDYGLSVRPVSE